MTDRRTPGTELFASNAMLLKITTNDGRDLPLPANCAGVLPVFYTEADAEAHAAGAGTFVVIVQEKP